MDLETLPRAALLLGALLVGCTTTTSGGAGERPETAEGPPRCGSDDDCVMSCVEANDCCVNPCGCDTVRHRQEHAAVQAANAKYCEDPAHRCDVDVGACDPTFEYATPRCVEGKCIAELPPGRSP